MTSPKRPRTGHSARTKERLAALIIAAAVLFSPPLLLIADRLPSVTGVWLVVYLFSVWAGIIGLAAWLMEAHETPGKRKG